MSYLDWTVLVATLSFIVLYGFWKTRNVNSTESYILGDRALKWHTIGLSIMATQASAITFLSTPGQGFDDGMRFAQFYFGLPIAMIILCMFVLPIFYRLKVYTAYEYLEQRFDLKTRQFTAFLFLLGRGLAAGITIYAPAIIMSVILGWSLSWTILILGIVVIAYTVFGGTTAVSQTQKQQMIIILSGLFVAFWVIINKLPPEVSFGDAVSVAGKMGKLNVVDFKFDLDNKYNMWSALFGGTFLFLSYFGTDQSQVQRYLSGKTLTESRLGLIFNGIFKVPMQFFVLFVGIMVFMFFQFTKPPVHFNPANVEILNSKPEYRDSLALVQQNFDEVFRDTDYVFISFVTTYLPSGLVGLLLAVIFYGTILGVFTVGFFIKNVKGNAIFWAAVIGELCVISIFFLDYHGYISIAYLWLNLIGCLIVVFVSLLLQGFQREGEVSR